jgi:hypothetical protein
MKKGEYIEKFPYGVKCQFSDNYIENKINELRRKLSRKGEVLSKNYRTQKVRVSWEEIATTQLYNLKDIKILSTDIPEDSKIN